MGIIIIIIIIIGCQSRVTMSVFMRCCLGQAKTVEGSDPIFNVFHL